MNNKKNIPSPRQSRHPHDRWVLVESTFTPRFVSRLPISTEDRLVFLFSLDYSPRWNRKFSCEGMEKTELKGWTGWVIFPLQHAFLFVLDVAKSRNEGNYSSGILVYCYFMPYFIYRRDRIPAIQNLVATACLIKSIRLNYDSQILFWSSYIKTSCTKKLLFLRTPFQHGWIDRTKSINARFKKSRKWISRVLKSSFLFHYCLLEHVN